jgi:hypothetical protein
MATQLRIRQEPEARVGQLARMQAGWLRLETQTAPASIPSERPDVRTCTHCGVHVAFRIDPLGCWAECPACGHLS